MMMWALAAAAAWFLWKQGTLDPYLGGFSDLFPGDEVAVNGNGEAVVVNGNGVLIDAGTGNGAGVAVGEKVAPEEGYDISVWDPFQGGGSPTSISVNGGGFGAITPWGDIYS